MKGTMWKITVLLLVVLKWNREFFNTLNLGFKMIKSRRMIWAGHIAHMGEMRTAYKL
jgi:hypothetical protein